jgi:hypothetical protein
VLSPAIHKSFSSRRSNEHSNAEESSGLPDLTTHWRKSCYHVSPAGRSIVRWVRKMDGYGWIAFGSLWVWRTRENCKIPIPLCSNVPGGMAAHAGHGQERWRVARNTIIMFSLRQRLKLKRHFRIRASKAAGYPAHQHTQGAVNCHAPLPDNLNYCWFHSP